MIRRDFLKSGFAALGSLWGGHLFAAPPGWRHGGKPNIIFGVISDTHLRTTATGKYSQKYWSDKWVVSALRHFRDQNVDAVIHCGDMAHLGQIEELEFHRVAWEKVFPGDIAPDGHRVERLFVTGNHDIDAPNYGMGEFIKRIYPDEAERKKHLLRTDIASSWERIWGEKYEPVWHRQVKGYHFFGRHFVADERRVAKLVDSVIGPGNAIRPFFHFAHFPPRARLNKALMRYPNAVGFFGHWHASAADWNRIIMRSAGPAIQCPSCCPYANNSLASIQYPWSKTVMEGVSAGGKSRQGYVVKVYDDMLVIERREFTHGGSLGADWVMPIGRYEPHPFSKDELRKAIGEPQFRKGAEVSVGWTKEKSHLRIGIPLADGNPVSRAFAYEVEIVGDVESQKKFKTVCASGVNMGIGHEPNKGETRLRIPKTELPSGEVLTFVTHPLTSLGTRGQPITAKFKL